MKGNPLYAAMRETVLQDAQRRFCATLNLPYYHIHRTDLGRGGGGFPDTVIVAGRVVWFIENKTEEGRLSPKQKLWQAALERATGIKYRLVRPSTWEATRDDILRDMEAAA